MTAKKGTHKLRARQLPDGRWRCSYVIDGKRKQITYADRDKMRNAMEKVLNELCDDEPTRMISEKEWREYQELKQAAQFTATVNEAQQRFLSALRLKPRRTDRSFYNVKKAVDSLVEHVGGDRRIAAIQSDEIEQWIHTNRNHASATKAYRRAHAVHWFKWLRNQELIPFAPTAAEKTNPVLITRPAPEILTPGEMEIVLQNVEARFLPFVVLSAFAGLRHMEMRKEATSRKDPLRWEDVNLETGYIRVRAETGKGKRGRARIIPISNNLAAWLRYIDAPLRIGPVFRDIAITNGETSRLAEILNRPKWPRNALRHSFGTYRMAQTRNVAQVSEEMGNSPRDVRNHYDAVVIPEEADRYFGIMPPSKSVSRTLANG